jgi:sterol desaturase/sphingolipid hydroxylase (fatty acid hydroxylase superfamily)
VDTIALLQAYAAPAIVLIALLEGLALSRLAQRAGATGNAPAYNWRAAFASLGVFAGRTVMGLIPLSLLAPLIVWADQHSLYDIAPDDAWAILGLFIGVEFFYYWYHRASHRVRWFWLNHAVHHSPNELNFSAAYRLGWTGKFTGAALFFLPLVWIGYAPELVFGAFALNLLYQFWIHSEYIPKLGPLEWVFNTPSAHRVHHAANLEYLDANYGGILILFDRMFGTYVEERDDLPCRYGLVHPLKSYNPFVIALHQWPALFKDLRSARSLRDVLGYFFAPPGWQPASSGRENATTEAMRARAASTPEDALATIAAARSVQGTLTVSDAPIMPVAVHETT